MKVRHLWKLLSGKIKKKENFDACVKLVSDYGYPRSKSRWRFVKSHAKHDVGKRRYGIKVYQGFCSKNEMISPIGSQGIVKPFLAIFLSLSLLLAGILGVIYYQGVWKIVWQISPEVWPAISAKILNTFLQLYAGLLVLVGIGSWLLVLTQTSYQLAQEELEQSAVEMQELMQQKDLLKRRLSSQIRNSLDLNEILNTAVNETRQLLQIDRCRFLEYSSDGDSPHFDLSYEACESPWCNVTQPEMGEVILHLNLLPIAAVSDSNLPCNLIRIDNIAQADQINAKSREIISSLGIISLLAITIKTNSGRIGAIVCEHGKKQHHWRDEEVELLQDIADRLAIAIDQAELYEQSRVTAAIATAQAQQLSKTLAELKQTQGQLVQTEKMSSLGQLVAGVAHEINNPVNFIYGNLSHADEYTEQLLDLVRLYQKYYPNPALEIEDYIADIDLEFLMEDLPKLLSSMKVGAERIRQIVLTLRNFSRIDEAEMKPVDIHEGIDSTLLILHNRVKAKSEYSGIKVVKEYGQLPQVECYAGQLNQVFMNVINNAIDALVQYNSQRKPEEICHNPSQIKISSEYVPESDRVRVIIADNGPGMPTEVKKRLFDPFFTTKGVGEGTGLGLSISYQIVVEKHGGSLTCISALGEGAKFCIEIPVCQSQRDGDRLKSAARDNVVVSTAR